MTLHLHIDSLALSGVKVSRRERPRLQAALEAELSRLFAVHGVPEALRQGGKIAKVPADLVLKGGEKVEEVGRAIARSIYTDLNPGEMRND